MQSHSMVIAHTYGVSSYLLDRLEYLENPSGKDLWRPEIWDDSAVSLSVNYNDYETRLVLKQIEEIKKAAFNYLSDYPGVFKKVRNSTVVMQSLEELLTSLSSDVREIHKSAVRKNPIQAPADLAADLGDLIDKLKNEELGFDDFISGFRDIKDRYVAWTEADRFDHANRDHSGSYFRSALRRATEWALREALLERRR